MARIAQIIPYFGKWPEWIDLYLYSCSRNPMIDFIIYTDCLTEGLSQYSNVKIVRTSVSEYEHLVSRRLGIEYRLTSPYKLTDLKPFLGAIHSRELERYDFWSFGDIDLCYGDLSIVLNDNNLRKYDLITTHCYHIAGHLTVVRNNDYYKNLCFKISDWQTKITESKHYALDESEWSYLVYPHIKYIRFAWSHVFNRLKLFSFFAFMNKTNRLINKRQFFYEYYTSPAPKENEEWVYNINSGKIYNPEGLELPYIHFLFFKKTQWHESEVFWRDDFYKLHNDFANADEIVVSLNGIVER